jgi:PIN domain nuclease of toxin-antitoxin system
VRLLLDTHFLIWTLLELPAVENFPWLDGYRPWGVSAISFLELAFLSEVGRLEVDGPALQEAVGHDPRFVIDEIPLTTLVTRALPLAWTRDPFDRLLAAHSLARGVPLCTRDRQLRERHTLLVPELRTSP